MTNDNKFLAEALVACKQASKDYVDDQLTVQTWIKGSMKRRGIHIEEEEADEVKQAVASISYNLIQKLHGHGYINDIEGVRYHLKWIPLTSVALARGFDKAELELSDDLAQLTIKILAELIAKAIESEQLAKNVVVDESFGLIQIEWRIRSLVRIAFSAAKLTPQSLTDEVITIRRLSIDPKRISAMIIQGNLRREITEERQGNPDQIFS